MFCVELVANSAVYLHGNFIITNFRNREIPVCTLFYFQCQCYKSNLTCILWSMSLCLSLTRFHRAILKILSGNQKCARLKNMSITLYLNSQSWYKKKMGQRQKWQNFFEQEVDAKQARNWMMHDAGYQISRGCQCNENNFPVRLPPAQPTFTIL